MIYICHYCGANTKIVDGASDTEEIVRKRKCLNCGKFSYTIEQYFPSWEGANFINENRYKIYRIKKKSFHVQDAPLEMDKVEHT